MQDFGIRTGSLDIRASSLSGGNQQKLALAKVLHPKPQVVVLDEPTRGVDVGAKRDIYFLIQRLAREGRGVVVISSELMELIGLCHRVAVMRGGPAAGHGGRPTADRGGADRPCHRNEALSRRAATEDSPW